jgi:hypothetical protein
MARLTTLLLVLALGAASAAGLSSCGGGSSADLLPGTTATQINSNLDEVQRLVNQGECVGAEDTAAEISAQVEDLKGVDRKLKAALEEGASQLGEVINECEESSEGETEQALEPDVEAEELEREEQEADEKAAEKADKAKEKAEKHGEEPSEEAAEENEEGGNLPPEPNGEAKGHEIGPPPATEEAPSGGVGPGVGVEG